MTRTRRQGLNNNDVKVPPSKGTTAERTPRPPVVSGGTSTEGLYGSGVSCCPAPDDDVHSIVNILCDCISDLDCTDRRFYEVQFAGGRRGSGRHREQRPFGHHLCRSCQIYSTDPECH